MSAILQDFRFALRLAARQPGATAIACLTLAVAIAATTTVFTVAYTQLLRPLPYPDSARLVRIAGSDRAGRTASLSAPDFLDLRAAVPSLEGAVAIRSTRRNLTGGTEPDRLNGAAVSSDFQIVARTPPAAGRFFTAEEFAAGDERAVLLSHRIWQSRFGGNPAVVGTTIHLDGRAATVVGVMPVGFDMPAGAQFWVPLTLDGGQRGARNLRAVGRLAPEASVAGAQAEAAAVAVRLEQTFPGSNRGVGIRIDPLLDATVAAVRPALLMLAGAVTLVLLVACANVANLLLARASARRGEMAVRLALGAGRARLVRQLLVESAVLSVAGGWLGLLGAAWGIGIIGSSERISLPRTSELGLHWNVVVLALGTMVATTVLFGTMPAFRATRIELLPALGERSRTTAALHDRSRRAIVVAELALAVLLLTGSGLLVRSFMRLQQVEAGFDPAGVLTFTVSLPEASYSSSDRVISFYERLHRDLSGIAGVRAAGLIFGLPLGSGGGSSSLEIQGRAPAGGPPIALVRAVGGQYFDALRIPVRRGRVFDDRDSARTAPVAIINETAARLYWPGLDPVGERVRIGASFVADQRFGYREIVGIVADVKHAGLDRDTRAEIYIPFQQQAVGIATAALRTDAEPLALVPAARERLRALDPSVPMSEIASMDQLVGRSVSARRSTMVLVSGFAVVAVLLAAVGVYGVISSFVAERRREIGIRLALGADRGAVVGMVVRQALGMAGVGLALGLLAAFPLTGVMRGLLFQIDPLDPVAFLSVPIVLGIAAVLASYLPSRRASRIDPAEALRVE